MFFGRPYNKYSILGPPNLGKLPHTLSSSDASSHGPKRFRAVNCFQDVRDPDVRSQANGVQGLGFSV